MSPESKIFAYCERGLDPASFAEPLNALSNGAFIVAGLAALYPATQRTQPGHRMVPIFLGLLVVAIGVGSFLFHTFATRWAALADVAPIGVFMLAYLAYVLRVLLHVPGPATLLLTLGFAVTLPLARLIRCDSSGAIVFAGAGHTCLNGSIGYLPALAAVIAIGTVLWSRRHRAGRALLAAGGLFALALFFRTIDREICAEVMMFGHPVGTHFLWHLLNALTLYILVRTAWPSLETAGRAASPGG